MAENKSPRERAVKNGKNTSQGKTAQAVAAAVGAAVAAKAISSSKNKGVTIVIIVVCLVIGLAIGFFGLSFLTKNDGFTMVGEDMVTLQMYDEYKEENATAVLFGKEYDVSVTYYYRLDLTHDIEKTEGVDTSVDGFYYAVYQTDAFLYKGTELIRTIEVKRVEDDGKEE